MNTSLTFWILYIDTIFSYQTDIQLTLDIHEYRVRAQKSVLVLCLTAVRSSVFRADWGEGMTLTWSPEQRLVVLEPGVLSCWVSITAAAQSHWTALLYFTRGSHGHWGGLWSVCHEYKIINVLPEVMKPCLVLSKVPLCYRIFFILIKHYYIFTAHLETHRNMYNSMYIYNHDCINDN